jgi:hydroxymethylpyrimidine/phosphomethylpyrimidine kinase
MTPYRAGGAVRRDVLVCSGLDPSGGAGLIADVRVVSELGAHAVDAEVVAHELDFLLTDVELAAVKIGMLGSLDVVHAIAAALNLTNAPVVWDPVLSPTRVAVPAAAPWLADATELLQPHLTLITPNASELAILSGMPTHDLAEAMAAGAALGERLECAVLIKGGHLGSDESVDVLWRAGLGVTEFRAPRVKHGESVHGTGCALSSAIAAHLANGVELVDACRLAKQFVLARITEPVQPGRGAPAVV